LKSPQIKISQANQPDWQIHANLAHATHGGKEITFTGNVIIQQDQKGNQLNTEELTYYPDQKLALSPATVQFKQPGSTVHSQGMRAYLDKKYIQLLSKPYATFNPKHA
jgi:lipopolysaccharide export system protein LptC